MQVLGLGYGWDDEVPFLRVRNLHDDAVRTLPMAGSVRLSVIGERRCTGYYDGAAGHPCPEGARLRTGTMCAACQQRDAFRPCMMCDGSRCPPLSASMRRYCRQDHHLYLACFGDETLKVGTASHPRRRRRVVEQGPLAAARVARAEGPVIKRMERALSQGAFTETMRRSRKTALLQATMSVDEAEARVMEAAAELPRLLDPAYHGALYPPQLVPQPQLAVRSRSLSVQPLQLADDVVLAGEVVGGIGHVVFLRDDDGVFAVDLGDLKARVLELDPRGGRKPVVQLGLF